MALVRIEQYFLEERYGEDSWAGAIVWECLRSERQGVYSLLYNSVMPDRSGTYAPRCRRIRMRPHPKFRDKMQVTTYYKSLREPGVATVRSFLTSRTAKAVRDLDDKIVQGPDPDGKHVWRVTSGNAWLSEPLEKVIVSTAATSVDWGNIRAKRWKVNSNYMPNIMGAQPGTFLLFAVVVKKELAMDSLFYLDYTGFIEPAGWNNAIKSQKAYWLVQQTEVHTQPTIDSAGRITVKPTGIGRYVDQQVLYPELSYSGTTWQPSEPESRRLWPEENFSDLDGMVRW